MQKHFGRFSGWIIDAVIDHTINISKYDLLDSSSSTKLSGKISHQKRVSLIFKILMIMNVGDGVKSDYWHLADYHPARIRKIDKIFEDQLDFEDTKHIDLLLIEKKIKSTMFLLKSLILSCMIIH